MRRLVISTIAASMLLLGAVSTALAVPLHQHYVTTPSGQVVPIAQGVCMNDLQNAVDNLHANVHQGAPAAAFASNPVGLTSGPCP